MSTKQRTRRRSFSSYNPLPNPLQPSTELLETYGQELDVVRRADPNRVWTVIDCDGTLYVTAGFHFVNRLNYIITEHPWESDSITFRW